MSTSNPEPMGARGVLEGRGILVTRPRDRAAALAKPLEAAGARVWVAPAIATAPPESFDALDRALERLRQYQWLVITSAEGVDAFVERLLRHGMDVRDLAHLRLAVIGRKTGARLREYGLRADLVPEDYRAEALADALVDAGVAGKTVLVPRSAVAREVLVEMLVAAGAFVDEVPSYTIERAPGLPDEVKGALRRKEVDMVTFTSSSTVEHFVSLCEARGVLEELRRLEVACIGPITAATATERGLEPAVVAEEYTIGGLVEAIRRHYASGAGKTAASSPVR